MNAFNMSKQRDDECFFSFVCYKLTSMKYISNLPIDVRKNAPDYSHYFSRFIGKLQCRVIIITVLSMETLLYHHTTMFMFVEFVFFCVVFVRLASSWGTAQIKTRKYETEWSRTIVDINSMASLKLRVHR